MLSVIYTNFLCCYSKITGFQFFRYILECHVMQRFSQIVPDVYHVFVQGARLVESTVR